MTQEEFDTKFAELLSENLFDRLEPGGDIIIDALDNLPRVHERLIAGTMPERRAAIVLLHFIFHFHNSLYLPESVESAKRYVLDCQDDNSAAYGLIFLGQVLEHAPNTELHEFVMGYLMAENHVLRGVAAQLMGELVVGKAVPLLTTLLYDEDEEVLDHVKDALERIGSPDALYALKEWKKNQANSNS